MASAGSMLMNLMGGLGGLMVALTWLWFLLFPLVVIAIGVGQAVRDSLRAAEAVPVEEMIRVLCPATGENLEVAVLSTGTGRRVSRCPRFGDGPVTCAQGCLS